MTSDLFSRGVIMAMLAMVGIVVVSNITVQFPINDWLTWGAFAYPVSFLITDLSNRMFGPAKARRVVYAGFAVGVLLSALFATPRIAVASGTAFLLAQLLDVTVFHRLRRQQWWKAPLVSSSLASTTDTFLFFSLAFVGTGLPWVTWGIGDLAVKLAVALAMLLPYGVLRHRLPVWSPSRL